MTDHIPDWSKIPNDEFDIVPDMQSQAAAYHPMFPDNLAYVESQFSMMQNNFDQQTNSTAYVPNGIDTCGCPSTAYCACYGCGVHPYNMVTQNVVQSAIQHMQNEDQSFDHTVGAP